MAKAHPLTQESLKFKRKIRISIQIVIGSKIQTNKQQQKKNEFLQRSKMFRLGALKCREVVLSLTIGFVD